MELWIQQPLLTFDSSGGWLGRVGDRRLLSNFCGSALKPSLGSVRRSREDSVNDRRREKICVVVITFEWSRSAGWLGQLWAKFVLSFWRKSILSWTVPGHS